MILDEELYQNEPQYQRLNSRQVFKNIWINPRLVFQSIKQYSTSSGILLFIFGILILPSVISAFQLFSDPLIPTSGYYLGTVAGGVFGKLLVYFLYALMLWITGMALKGKANYSLLLRVVIIASIPSICYGAVSSIWNLVEMYTYSDEAEGMTGLLEQFPAAQTTGIVFSGIFGFWNMILVVVGVRTCQEFNTGKAVINVILAILIFAIPAFGLFIAEDLGLRF
ncbi:MAG: YIP1 family protein [Schleiferiaceae bacterium]|jgi:hypothetical protein|nr:YIP1 family protein [Schleiferiaceae bacterium]